MITSMTSFGSAVVALPSGALTVELRTLNHRSFDLRWRLPAALESSQAAAEDLLRRKLTRGRVEVRVRLSAEVAGAVQLDAERARLAYAQLQALKQALHLLEPITLAHLLSMPACFVAQPAGDESLLQAAFLQALSEACEASSAMRQREGTALAEDLRRSLRCIAAAIAAIEERSEVWRQEQKQRLQQRARELVEATGALDVLRLEQEMALLVERADVQEELTRLRSHTQQQLELLEPAVAAPPGLHGRKIEFVLQEMLREANTIGAKIGDLAAVRQGIEIKLEIERLREQAQNIL